MLRNWKPAKIIALGFAIVIMVGTLLLLMPGCTREGVHLKSIDAFFTAASAVCVTGLIVVDVGDTFTPLGQIIVGSLIQIGGIGVASVGVGMILALGKKVDLKGRLLLRESFNLNTGGGLIRFLKKIIYITVLIELTGAVLSFTQFSKDYPLSKAIGISLFHSVAAFNNAGFDILGNFKNLEPYQNNIILNLVTCALIFLGGIGYLVILDVLKKRFRFRKFALHSKVVITTSVVLIVLGTLLLKMTESISWLGAFFNSVSARTAGFTTFPIGKFSNVGLLVLIVLMFIGASPGSTGGGIKTSTFFVLIKEIGAAAGNRSAKAFHYRISSQNFKKAAIVLLLGLVVVILGTFGMLLLEPDLSFIQVLFEITSAFGTTGLSTGITPNLSEASKILCVFIMYIGRLGPLTLASLLYVGKEEMVSYPEGDISIG